MPILLETLQKKSERIKELFITLNKEQKQFTSARDAHRYIKTELGKIEERYLMTMSIFPLNDFSFEKQLNIYSFKAPKHFIFFNENGAYGIYRLPIPFFDFLENIDFYKEGSTCLVNICAQNGGTLW